MSNAQFWFNIGFAIVVMLFCAGGAWWLRRNWNHQPNVWVLLGLLATAVCLGIMAVQLSAGMLAH